MTLIFLSYSSNDAEFVKALSEYIELELDNVEVFASSRPDAIGSGVEWRNDVLTNLENSSVLIILITAPSENSVWVGFELGYFWHKTDGTHIHALKHPTAKLAQSTRYIASKILNRSARS